MKTFLCMYARRTDYGVHKTRHTLLEPFPKQYLYMLPGREGPSEKSQLAWQLFLSQTVLIVVFSCNRFWFHCTV